MAVRIDTETDGYQVTAVAGNTFTFLCWAMVSVDRNAYSTIIDYSTTTSNFMQFSTNADGVTLGIYHQSGGVDVGAMTVGAWHRVAVSCDGTTMRCYLGGLTGTIATASVAMPSGFSANTLRIGKSVWSGEFFNGRIAGFKGWNVALSAAEIESEFTQYYPVRFNELLRLYPLVTASTVDYSGNNNTLTAGSATPATEDGPPIRWSRKRSSRTSSSLAAPIVDAGADTTVTNRTPFGRTAIETGGAPDTREWKIFSGPADVGSVLDTDDTVAWIPSVPGTYVLRYTATNAAGSGFDDVTVTVDPVVVAMSGNSSAISSGTSEFIVATKLSKSTTAHGTAVGAASVAAKLSKTVTANATATGNLRSATKISKTVAAHGSVTALLRASVRVSGSSAGVSLATGVISTAKQLSASATGGSAASGAVYRVRLLDAPTLTGSGSVTKAVLAAPSGGIARADATATGSLLHIRSVKAVATGNSTASASARVVSSVSKTVTAQSVVTARLTAAKRYNDVIATGGSAALASLRKVQFHSAAITGVSLASADYMLGATSINGYGQAISALNNASAQVITGLRETVTSIGTITAPLQRAAVAKGVSVAHGTVTFDEVLGRSRLMNAPLLRGNGTIAPAVIQRTVVFHPQLEATSAVAPVNLRVIVDVGFNKITAVSSVRERSIRLVITTATAHGEVNRDRVRSVNAVSGFMTVQSYAEADLIWAPVRHLAQATSSVIGGLVALKQFSEELRASGVVTRHLSAARAMSSIIAIMDDSGEYVPVDRTGHYELAEEETPVVFSRTFMLMRQ